MLFRRKPERRAVRARHRLRAHIRPLLRLAFSLLCLVAAPSHRHPVRLHALRRARLFLRGFRPHPLVDGVGQPAGPRRGHELWGLPRLRAGLQSINQVKAAIIGNIEPVLATFWVWLFWNENFSAYGWAGSALVISAVFLLTADRS
ncbi:MAG: DMT family transporter [Bilophila wadsworthia]